MSTKYNKSLVFMELILELPLDYMEEMLEENFSDNHIFVIDSSNQWYGDILIYLQTI